MTWFATTGGHRLAIVEGFREAVLDARPSGTPRAGWTDADYARVAARRVVAARRRVAEIRAALGSDAEVRALEIGCGSGLDSAIAALDGIGDVLAIDHSPALFAADERGERASRLVSAALHAAGSGHHAVSALQHLPLRVQAMDATALDLPDDSVDVVWSRTALEHVQPIERGLRELARVLRPGGIAHHIIDPFYWVKGCHAGGLTDLPWAHARLTAAEYAGAVAIAEGARRAARRSAYLATLNHLGLADWRAVLLASADWELLSWRENRSPLAQALLAEHPDVPETLLPGVTTDDLDVQSITVMLRLR